MLQVYQVYAFGVEWLAYLAFSAPLVVEPDPLLVVLLACLLVVLRK